jgi:hypothetical protein
MNMNLLVRLKATVKVIMGDVVAGMFLITHNFLALFGLFVFSFALIFTTQADLRNSLEVQINGWMQNHFGLEIGLTDDNNAIHRVTAIDPTDLPKEQADIALWLSRKYRIAPEPLGALVAEAYNFGQKKNLDPTLILAVMAIESGFNPLAQSSMGAQGLMQVITDLQPKKYASFGGKFAAFDPIANLRVGAAVLRENIDRKGSIESGLRQYVGAGSSGEDGGYVAKVLIEQQRLRDVSNGQLVPVSNSNSATKNKDLEGESKKSFSSNSEPD